MSVDAWFGGRGGKLRLSREPNVDGGWGVSAGGTRGGGGGATMFTQIKWVDGKRRRDAGGGGEWGGWQASMFARTNSRGCVISVGGTVVSFDVHASQVTHHGGGGVASLGRKLGGGAG